MLLTVYIPSQGIGGEVTHQLSSEDSGTVGIHFQHIGRDVDFLAQHFEFNNIGSVGSGLVDDFILAFGQVRQNQLLASLSLLFAVDIPLIGLIGSGTESGGIQSYSAAGHHLALSVGGDHCTSLGIQAHVGNVLPVCAVVGKDADVLQMTLGQAHGGEGSIQLQLAIDVELDVIAEYVNLVLQFLAGGQGNRGSITAGDPFDIIGLGEDLGLDLQAIHVALEVDAVAAGILMMQRCIQAEQLDGGIVIRSGLVSDDEGTGDAEVLVIQIAGAQGQETAVAGMGLVGVSEVGSVGSNSLTDFQIVDHNGVGLLGVEAQTGDDAFGDLGSGRVTVVTKVGQMRNHAADAVGPQLNIAVVVHDLEMSKIGQEHLVIIQAAGIVAGVVVNGVAVEVTHTQIHTVGFTVEVDIAVGVASIQAQQMQEEVRIRSITHVKGNDIVVGCRHLFLGELDVEHAVLTGDGCFAVGDGCVVTENTGLATEIISDHNIFFGRLDGQRKGAHHSNHAQYHSKCQEHCG